MKWTSTSLSCLTESESYPVSVHFSVATSLRPDVGMFWRFLADACAMLGERDEAERNYRKALSSGINDAIANAKYGLLLKRSGRFRKAQAYLQRALDFNPRLAKAHEALEELRASKLVE